MRKWSYILILMLVLAFSITACGSKDLTKGKTGTEILSAAYEKMQEVENFEMDLEMKMAMSPPGQSKINMNIKGSAIFFQKPMRMNMEMVMKDPMTEEEVTIEQYMEETEEGTNIYQGTSGQWIKMNLKDKAFAEMMNMDPSKSLAIYLENLEKAEVLGEEKLGEKETVMIEMIASSKMYEEIMKNLPSGNMLPNQLPLDPSILSEIGDIKGIIWVDKLTLDILKTSMDMTENIQNLGKTFVTKGIMPEEAAQVFTGMEMAVEYEMKNFNNAKEFSIPEEARSAPEFPMQ